MYDLHDIKQVTTCKETLYAVFKGYDSEIRAYTVDYLAVVLREGFVPLILQGGRFTILGTDIPGYMGLYTKAQLSNFEIAFLDDEPYKK